MEDKRKIESEEDYWNEFSGNGTSDSKTIEAFRFALDTRKFEIDLYWKRTAYFWTFISVVFTGFGLLQWEKTGADTGIPDGLNGTIQFFLACFGFLLSFSWYFTNRGSKQWQENWEHHVDQLEDRITGPLYKTVLKRRLPQHQPESDFKSLTDLRLAKIDFLVAGPSAHSVSKINQIISLYVTFLWCVLLVYAIFGNNNFTWNFYTVVVLVTTLVTAQYIAFFARTSFGPHGHYAEVRKSTILKNNVES
ncbi:RipA family octameric membrane protein [Vibrio diazotrophicus]|uniref:RipA family octameric membrane protein n=1 Tax=Vibrio diazotrophicus TaxID=685 RepID=UPI000C9DB34F|nr:hypothetical protein [Vibrio diazotrophicus]PNH88136.1 hypothetical protein C1M59_20445 [Vibrio diazotrophicus]